MKFFELSSACRSVLNVRCGTDVQLLSIATWKWSIVRASIFVSMVNWRPSVQFTGLGIINFSTLSHI